MAAAAPSPHPGGAAVSRPSGRGGAATTLVCVGRRRCSGGEAHGGRGVTPRDRGHVGAMGASPWGTNQPLSHCVRAVRCSFSKSCSRSRRCRPRG